MSVRKISPELLEVSIKENNEVPDQVAKDIQHLREWLKFQPHLRSRSDDQFLLNTLRLCKFSMQKSKEMIDITYSLQSAIPELTYNRDVSASHIQEILSLGIILPIRELASNSAPRVVIYRCAPIDTTKHSINTIATTIKMFHDFLQEEDDNTVVSGKLEIFDFSGLTMNLVINTIPFINSYRKYARPAQRTIKHKRRGYYLLNSNPFFEKFYNIFKHLLEDKQLNKVKFFNENNMDDFKNLVPLSILPKEYGGKGDTIEELTSYWKNKVSENREWFLEQDKYGVDENLRIEKVSYFEEHAGMEGSFKSLDID